MQEFVTIIKLWLITRRICNFCSYWYAYIDGDLMRPAFSINKLYIKDADDFDTLEKNGAQFSTNYNVNIVVLVQAPSYI